MTDMTPDRIIDFWFLTEARDKWFRSTEEFDQHIRDRYETLWQQTANGERESWKDSARGCLALCIVLDQFPLNMYRNQARSFRTETAAIEISKHAIKQGFDQQLAAEQQAFIYMPLMHSEDLADQDRSVQCFEKASLAGNLRFAKHHRELIRRYGRFPHRNAILGRETTPEEITYLNSKEAFTG